MRVLAHPTSSDLAVAVHASDVFLIVQRRCVKAFSCPAAIVCLCLSSDGSHVCVALDNKAVLLLSIDWAKVSSSSPDALPALKGLCACSHTWQSSKRPTALALVSQQASDDSLRTQLVLADKFGDFFITDVTSEGAEIDLAAADPAGGHVSMLLDVAVTPDGKYVLTCDRDEKMRVSLLSKPYIIHSFCLGHREFVSCVCVVDERRSVTGSGDGTLYLWDHIKGLCTHVADLRPLVPSFEHLAVRSVAVREQTLAAVVDGVSKLFVYRLPASAAADKAGVGESDWQAAQIIDLAAEPVNVSVAADGSILAGYFSATATRHLLAGGQGPQTIEAPDAAKSDSGHPELQQLYHAETQTGVEEYFQRKRARLEGKKPDASVDDAS